MRSFRRLALLLALGLPAMPAVLAQSSSSIPPTQTPAQDQGQAQQPPAAATPQQLSVQARIRARREQRRAAAIHDVYSHRYETFADMGYLRFKPGPCSASPSTPGTLVSRATSTSASALRLMAAAITEPPS
jgi:hypothetical protein